MRHDDQLRQEELERGDAPGAPIIAPGQTAISSYIPRGPIARAEDPGPPRELAGLLVARDGNGVAEGADAALARADGAGGGSPLPGDVRARFESSLGADLGGVRVHTGAESASAAAAVGARAYTVGKDIHFGEGNYRPDDPFGVHLLAHEVAHTVQQAGGSTQRQHKLEVSSPGDAAEVEADRAADAMVAGRPAEVSGGPTIASRAVDPATGRDTGAGNAAVAPGAGAAGAAPMAGGTPPKVTVTITEKAGAAIVYDAKDYATLYQQVKARADTGAEAGSCTCGQVDCSYTTLDDKVTAVTIKVPLETSLPTWKQKASQPKEHQDKFDTWAASVKVHEDEHLRIYRDGYNKMKTLITATTEAECDKQYDAQVAQIEKDQIAFDADKSKQPAGLPIPGGTTKIGADGSETPKANAADEPGAAPMMAAGGDEPT